VLSGPGTSPVLFLGAEGIRSSTPDGKQTQSHVSYQPVSFSSVNLQSHEGENALVRCQFWLQAEFSGDGAVPAAVPFQATPSGRRSRRHRLLSKDINNTAASPPPARHVTGRWHLGSPKLPSELGWRALHRWVRGCLVGGGQRMWHRLGTCR